MRTTERTVYTWKRRYREEGCEGLRTREKPGGRNRLSGWDIELLKRLLRQKDYWTTREVRDLIKGEFGVEFTVRHVTQILRQMGMRYQKPYVNDLKRPKDAEAILKKLKRAGLSKEVILGFLDESSHYPNTNSARLWSFGKLRLQKNTAKKERVNSFGFYALNRASVYSTKDSSKKEAVIGFLEEVRKRNNGRRIVMILDNFRAHTSWKTREAAEELGIELVFLPPYSPDLNPIKFIWKSIKRELSALFLRWREEVMGVVEALFYELTASLSFAKRWIEKFLVPL